MALLKKLVASELIDPSWISMEKTNGDVYRLKIKRLREPIN
jgi:hypothetical protein